MKYANLIHTTGAIVIIAYALLKILHLGQDLIDVNLLLPLGFFLGYIGQSMKVNFLEKEIKSNKAGTIL